MAKPGAKPKAGHLRLVDGTHRTTRHGAAEQAREAIEKSAATFGRPVKPGNFNARGQAAWAWKRFIEPASWLDASREPAAIAFCELWQEFRFSPTGFPASKHGQLRAYMSELGLTDERNRVSGDGKEQDPADKHF